MRKLYIPSKNLQYVLDNVFFLITVEHQLSKPQSSGSPIIRIALRKNISLNFDKPTINNCNCI